MEPAEDRIILAPERRQLVPYCDQQIWRKEKDGTFPKRIKLGPHRVGWSLRGHLQQHHQGYRRNG